MTKYTPAQEQFLLDCAIALFGGRDVVSAEELPKTCFVHAKRLLKAVQEEGLLQDEEEGVCRECGDENPIEGTSICSVCVCKQ